MINLDKLLDPDENVPDEIKEKIRALKQGRDDEEVVEEDREDQEEAYNALKGIESVFGGGREVSGTDVQGLLFNRKKEDEGPDDSLLKDQLKPDLPEKEFEETNDTEDEEAEDDDEEIDKEIFERSSDEDSLNNDEEAGKADRYKEKPAERPGRRSVPQSEEGAEPRNAATRITGEEEDSSSGAQVQQPAPASEEQQSPSPRRRPVRTIIRQPPPMQESQVGDHYEKKESSVLDKLRQIYGRLKSRYGEKEAIKKARQTPVRIDSDGNIKGYYGDADKALSALRGKLKEKDTTSTRNTLGRKDVQKAGNQSQGQTVNNKTVFREPPPIDPSQIGQYYQRKDEKSLDDLKDYYNHIKQQSGRREALEEGRKSPVRLDKEGDVDGYYGESDEAKEVIKKLDEENASASQEATGRQRQSRQMRSEKTVHVERMRMPAGGFGGQHGERKEQDVLDRIKDFLEKQKKKYGEEEVVKKARKTPIMMGPDGEVKGFYGDEEKVMNSLKDSMEKNSTEDEEVKSSDKIRDGEGQRKDMRLILERMKELEGAVKSLHDSQMETDERLESISAELGELKSGYDDREKRLRSVEQEVKEARKQSEKARKEAQKIGEETWEEVDTRLEELDSLAEKRHRELGEKLDSRMENIEKRINSAKGDEDENKVEERLESSIGRTQRELEEKIEDRFSEIKNLSGKVDTIDSRTKGNQRNIENLQEGLEDVENTRKTDSIEISSDMDSEVVENREEVKDEIGFLIKGFISELESKLDERDFSDQDIREIREKARDDLEKLEEK